MKDAFHGNDKAEVIARYVKRFIDHGSSLDALNIGKLQNYVRQHEVHLELIQSKGDSIIDVGCGIGSFYQFLCHKGLSFNYHGIDIVPEFIDSAKVSYPKATFEIRDIFKQGLDRSADHILMCQVFNSRFKYSDNATVIREALKICFDKTKHSVSIDMLSSYVGYEESTLFYSNPEEMFLYAKTLTPYVIMRHDYSPHHFTLGLYKR